MTRKCHHASDLTDTRGLERGDAFWRMRLRGLDTEKAEADGFGGGLGAVVDVEFLEDAADVLFDGVFGDAEGGGDFFVGVATGDEGEDLEFAGGDVGSGEALLEASGDVGGEALATGGDGADGFEEIGAGGGLLEVAEGASAKGAMDFFVAGEGGEDEDACGRVGGEDIDGGFDATDAGELEVHEDDVWEVGGVGGVGLLTRVGFGDDIDIGLEGE